MNQLAYQTLASIVKENHAASVVFEKYRLDFCCKGKRTLQDACEEKQLPLQGVLSELHSAMGGQPVKIDFKLLSAAALIDHIIRVHHLYVKMNLPQIQLYVSKVAQKHGERFPYMLEVFYLVTELRNELEEHMRKEEQILFPWIKLLEEDPKSALMNADNISILMYEDEHDVAGNIMERIANLTNVYAIPEGACTTFTVSLSFLQAFEADLHQHVHLENNILFPKVTRLLALHKK